MRFFIILFSLALIFLSFSKGRYSYVTSISAHMESKTLQEDQVTKLEAEVLYAIDGELIMQYTYPFEYIVITNSIGEMEIYDPKENTVSKQFNAMYSSKSGYFNYFISDKIHDLGLKEMQFTLTETKFEDGYTITTWRAPDHLSDKLSYIELVHENYVPIYIAYFDVAEKLIRKVYYYEYIDIDAFSLPQKITEFNYMDDGDSVITKTTYSDVKVNEEVNLQLLNFKIPDDAKILDSKVSAD